MGIYSRGSHLSMCGLVLAAGLAITSAAATASEYRLQPGDVVELSVAGLPDLRHQARIDISGEASFPLIGEVEAGGLKLQDLRAKLRELYPNQVYRSTSSGADSSHTVILPEEITLVMGEYRPIYLTGDVAKPGEQVFRPGLTVRQAVAIAGGYDALSAEVDNPILRSADIRGQYIMVEHQYLTEIARVKRLETELGMQVSTAPGGISSADVVSQVADVEEEMRKLRQSDHEQEKAFVEATLAQSELRISQLEKQHENEGESLALDVDELSRIEDLQEKGLATVPRLVETRRALLLSSTRALQTSVQVEQAKRERSELASKLDRMDEQRRIVGLSELQDARAKARGLRARMDALSEQLILVGGDAALSMSGGESPSLEVVRVTSEGTQEIIAAEEDTELRPGDVIQVEIRSDVAGGGSM